MFSTRPITLHALCFVLLFSFFTKTNAQTTNPSSQFSLRTDLIPPSPNAASLGKYGIVPVSLQTGIPNISIPITEAVGKQLKIPITLNYHNNGLKPFEEASWVGAGWSLDAGGVITRIIKDKVDEDQHVTNKYQDVDWRFHQPDSITQSFMEQAMYGLSVDLEPDIYAFNFAGHSGKFVLYKGKVYQYPYQQLTIIRETAVDGFTIITPEGTTYRFWTTELTNSKITQIIDAYRPFYNPPVSYTSSWYLQTVTSADTKDQILFTYDTPEVVAQAGPLSQTLNVDVTNSLPGYTFSQLGNEFPLKVGTIRLSRITTSKMRIDFNPTTSKRQDMTSSGLDNIQVYNYLGELINKFQLKTDYFNVSGTADTKRLKLTGIEEGLNPATLKKHFFFYNSDVAYSKTSTGVDHWGYANGSSNGPVIIPKPYYPYGVSREPDISYSNKGILSKIVYPTGGSTLFEYEQNLTNNGLNYVYNTLGPSDFISRPDTNTVNVITSTPLSFQVVTAQYVKVNWQRTPKDVAGYPNGRLPTDPTKNFTPDVIITGSQTYNFSILTNSDNAGKTDSVLLQPGTYTMTIKCDEKENYVAGSVSYRERTNQVIEGKAGPGIRIKRITDYTDFLATGTPSSVKEYIYKDSIGMSTGVLLNIPDYGGKDYWEGPHTIGGVTQPTPVIHYLAYTSANSNGLSASQPMYYKTVYEKQVNGSDYLLSRSDYNYYNSALAGADVMLVRKTDFKKTGSVYNKVLKKEYNYSVVGDSSFFAIKPFVQKRWVTGEPTERVYTYDFYSLDLIWTKLDSEKEVKYYNTSDTLVTTKTYVYDAKPRNQVLITTNDSKGTTLVEKNKYPENYATAVSGALTARYVYAPVLEKQLWLKRSATDSVLTNSAVTSYDGSLIKPAVLYGYNSMAPVASMNQEAKNGSGQYLNLLSSSTGFEQRILNTYDYTSGNLVSQDMTGSDGNSQVSYLWGYHNNYPIAQVKNTTISSVAYTSFEDDDTSWPYTAASVVITDARTGVKCYNGTMTKSGLPSGNYTVSLWAKGSGTVTVGGVAKTITASWQVYDWALTGVTSVTVNSNGNLIDEVRLVPANAMMNTYTYKPEVGVLSITDTKGLTQFYEYDDMKRLLNIRDQDGNILKNFNYNYAIPQPSWVNTGATQCVQGVSGNTGEQLIQQRDNNTLSPTYNQYQWISGGTNTTACPIPVTIYVEMFYGATTTTNGSTYRPFIFKAFSDANGSVPINVPVNLSVNYQQSTTYTYYDGRPSYTSIGNGSITITAGTNQATTASIKISGCQGLDTKMICTNTNLSLQAGDGYQTIIIDP
ncbi:hypothetical protein [Mucilaginibacter sp. OK283]|uniref:hypothetical protein n=1 Tax=Mucilaginibacter sp. OK283 TaxID=1881049 RepID=UPI0008AE4ACE|nr:hypothetical protein [Mucilaginibacter sp. OK283]SEP38543.1 hypothetical protein SAMN05428947_113134 [Mucilaginibacter sp. OK283]